MEPKERILLKSGELFMQYGIRSVSMDDIANNLGMSKKTLYQYFSDKDELVTAVVEAHITDMQTDCSHCQVKAIDAVHEIFITMDTIMQEIGNMNPMLLYDLEKFHFNAYRKFKEHKEKFLYTVIRKNIEWGIKDELYRNEIDVDVISRFRIEAMLIPFNVTVFPPGKYNMAAISEMIIEHFIYGLVTLKGHKLIQKYHEQRKNKISYDESKN
ncbi:MAG: TetR/AcrR family transcriptional regulator [Chitinophagaceae bacterium]|nr:TetR/AcrR family transcriptional regulator [Chitinophagaceae bacterium]